MFFKSPHWNFVGIKLKLVKKNFVRNLRPHQYHLLCSANIFESSLPTLSHCTQEHFIMSRVNYNETSFITLTSLTASFFVYTNTEPLKDQHIFYILTEYRCHHNATEVSLQPKLWFHYTKMFILHLGNVKATKIFWNGIIFAINSFLCFSFQRFSLFVFHEDALFHWLDHRQMLLQLALLVRGGKIERGSIFKAVIFTGFSCQSFHHELESWRQCWKTFFLFTNVNDARVFVLGKPFQLTLTFASKVAIGAFYLAQNNLSIDYKHFLKYVRLVWKCLLVTNTIFWRKVRGMRLRNLDKFYSYFLKIDHFMMLGKTMYNYETV